MALIEIPDHLYEDVEQLIKDKGAKNAPDNKDIDALVSEPPEEYTEYWGETVTAKRNWQSSPDHPKTFLAYITVAEAKMLRSMGLGYSEIDGKFQQHYDKYKIPSFNGSFGGNNNEGEAEAGNNTGGGGSGGGGYNTATGESTPGIGGSGTGGGSSTPAYSTPTLNTPASDMYFGGRAVGPIDAPTTDLSGTLSDAVFGGSIDQNGNFGNSFGTLGGRSVDSYGDTYSYFDPVKDTIVTVNPSVPSVVGPTRSVSQIEATFYGTKSTTSDSIVGQMQLDQVTRSTALGSFTTDQHYNDLNEQLGFVDETVADMLEAFGVTVNPEVASAIQSSTTALMGILAGVPSTVLGVAVMAANVAKAVADVAYANGYMDKDTRNAIRGVAATISLIGTAISTIQTLSMISSLRSHGVISSIEAAMYTTTAALELGMTISAFSSTMSQLGIQTSPTPADVAMFSSSGEGGEANDMFEKTGDIKNVYLKFGQWYKANVDGRRMDVNTAQEDPFEYMAGGIKYDIMLAGQPLYHPMNLETSDTCVKFTLDMDLSARRLLLQEQAIYKDLQPVKTKLEESGSNKISMAKVTRFNNLVEERNLLVEEYNVRVDIFNAQVSGYQGDLSVLQADIARYNAMSKDPFNQGTSTHRALLASIKARVPGFETRQANLTTAKTALEIVINGLMEQIGGIETEIIDLVS